MKINIVGDLCLHKIDTLKYSLDERIKNIFQNSDLNIANLESPLTYRKKRKDNIPIALKGIPQNNEIFDLFQIFSLANNHIMDYREKGFKDTIDFLENNNKSYFGAGDNIESAFSPLKISLNDKKLAFLGFTKWVNARKKKAGTTPVNISKLSKIIKKLKEDGYFTIIMPHWNYEYVYFPAPVNRKRSRKLINAGADIIVGSHPHIIQGYEEYKGKMVFHSLGNFIFHSDVFKPISMIKNDKRLNISFILQLSIDQDYNYNFKTIPISTFDDHISVLSGNKLEKTLSLLEKISKPLKDERLYKKLFYRDSNEIIKQTTKIMRKLLKNEGLINFLKTCTRIKMQDIKIRLYPYFHKLDKSSITYLNEND